MNLIASKAHPPLPHRRQIHSDQLNPRVFKLKKSSILTRTSQSGLTASVTCEAESRFSSFNAPLALCFSLASLLSQYQKVVPVRNNPPALMTLLTLAVTSARSSTGDAFLIEDTSVQQRLQRLDVSWIWALWRPDQAGAREKMGSVRLNFPPCRIQDPRRL